MPHLFKMILTYGLICCLLASCRAPVPAKNMGNRAEVGETEVHVYAEDGSTIYKSYIHSHESVSRGEFTVVPADSLLVLSQKQLLYKIDGFTANDPRSLLVSEDTIIFSMGAVAIAKYEPSQVDHLFQWLTANRQVFAIDLPTGRLLWGNSELESGTPLAFVQKNKFVSLRASKPRDILNLKEGVEKFILCKADIRTRMNEQAFEFEVSTTSPVYQTLVNVIFGFKLIDNVVCEWDEEAPVSLIIDGSPILVNSKPIQR